MTAAQKLQRKKILNRYESEIAKAYGNASLVKFELQIA
jgi:long-subunit acyl-CoA synthetase (AMP-forming)